MPSKDPNIKIWTFFHRLPEGKYMIEVKATYEGVDYRWTPTDVFDKNQYPEIQAMVDVHRVFYADIVDGTAPRDEK